MEKKFALWLGILGGTAALVLIAFGLGVGLGFAEQNSESDQSKINFRLPKSIVPFHYFLKVQPILEPHPDFERFTSIGLVKISAVCHEPTSTIVLHASNMTIFEGQIYVKVLNGAELRITSIWYDTTVDFFGIQLEQELEVGLIYEIEINFKALIPEDRLNGMYRDYYDDPETEERNYVATTLFAPYHARKAFPCFDEPDFRAKFDIVVGRLGNYTAMSNGRLVSSEPHPELQNWYWDTFETTPSISTYIIAMIVSNFAFEEAPIGSFRNVSVRTYAAPYQVERGGATYAVNLAAKLLTYFEQFFKIPYPLPKAYSVALPHFFFNAMENWGLITYKEPVILYFPNETTEADRYKINYVTSHELAHQWFGNLVSCKWWAYVWLKEGFATFYAHFGMNHTNPELEPWINFPTTVLKVAMDFDITEKTHPLENYPKTTAEVADIYTRIPYEKGASILRMTSKFVTENVFHDGIRKYVDQFQYKSAEQNDMFQAIHDVIPANTVPIPLKFILDTWTTQSGFPLLKVSASGSEYLLIKQEKFIGEDPSNPDHTWWIPITTWPKAKLGVDEDFPDIWLPQNVRQVLLRIDTQQTVVVNPRAIGYFRVLYDAELTQRIQKHLETNHIDLPVTGRSQILSDYFSLADAGYIPIETALNLTKYLQYEFDWSVWKTVRKNTEKMFNLFVGTEHFKNFKDYWSTQIPSKFESSADWLGNYFKKYPEDQNSDYSYVPSQLQLELLEWFDLLDAQGLRTQARDLISKWRDDPEHKNLIPNDFQPVFYCSAISTDNLTESVPTWNFIYQKFLVEKSTVLKNRFLKSLTCTRNEVIVRRLLEITKSENSEVRLEDKVWILKYVSETPHLTSLVFNFITENTAELNISLKSTKPITDAITAMSKFMKSTEDLQILEKFIKSPNSEILKSNWALEAAAQTVQKNMKWVKNHAESASLWFKSHSNYRNVVN